MSQALSSRRDLLRDLHDEDLRWAQHRERQGMLTHRALYDEAAKTGARLAEVDRQLLSEEVAGSCSVAPPPPRM